MEKIEMREMSVFENKVGDIKSGFYPNLDEKKKSIVGDALINSLLIYFLLLLLLQIFSDTLSLESWCRYL